MGLRPAERYFYPRSPCGERPLPHTSGVVPPGFLSTLSLRRATVTLQNIGVDVDISIHALLAESDDARLKMGRHPWISIHALLAESDPKSEIFGMPSKISIHALLAESDPATLQRVRPAQQFLSTLSLRRATDQNCDNRSSKNHFYPRSPCGERQQPV